MGLSLVPTAAGNKVRQHKGFGVEPAMVVSLYSWGNAGDICVLVELTSRVRSKRNTSPKPA